MQMDLSSHCNTNSAFQIRPWLLVMVLLLSTTTNAAVVAAEFTNVVDSADGRSQAELIAGDAFSSCFIYKNVQE